MKVLTPARVHCAFLAGQIVGMSKNSSPATAGGGGRAATGGGRGAVFSAPIEVLTIDLSLSITVSLISAFRLTLSDFACRCCNFGF